MQSRSSIVYSLSIKKIDQANSCVPYWFVNRLYSCRDLGKILLDKSQDLYYYSNKGTQ